MQIPLLEGRAFQETDHAPGTRVAIVNHTMADRFWPGRSPIGQHIRLGQPDAPSWKIVGVVRDAKYALWACWVPARRAMKVDPVVTLRHE